MNFWLMRPAGGTKYTAIEMEKHKASKTGVNSVSQVIVNICSTSIYLI